MSTHTRTEVQAYLERMRAALSDLPAAEVADVLDDAETHVVEIADELGEEFSSDALVRRLGSPEAYAQELRAAAGYPAPAAASTPAAPRYRLIDRLAFWGLALGTVATVVVAGGRDGFVPLFFTLLGVAALAAAVFGGLVSVARIAELPEARSLFDALERARRDDGLGKLLTYLKTLQPGWWVARSLLVLMSPFLIGRYHELVLFLVVLAVLSFLAGSRSQRDRRWLFIGLPANGLAVGTVLLGLGVVVLGVSSNPSSYGVSHVPQQPSLPENVYVFDAEGNALTGVYLYDQDGRPLDSAHYDCAGYSDQDNRYPKPRVDYGGPQGCRVLDGVPFAVAIPTERPYRSSSSAPTTTVPTTSVPTTTLPTTTAPQSEPSALSSASTPPSAPVTTG
ncbi:HAAS signaling domain-containing protein [Umezawaea beigongshangensis]|uniref:HAAS signaling domain-containing protein n=1 Tax=Umezawaea beigongshangensis TaxID=2780383 RepID=UPI0018F20DBF|nr:hypothetical protein [Umezawaea beigongshangensis]